MNRIAQLQFSTMASDAQCTAIRRLALKGLDDAEISMATGWTEEQIRQLLAPPLPLDFVPLALLRNRRSGSPGGSVTGA